MKKQNRRFNEIEIYYCISFIQTPNTQEGHSFNVVKRKNDYALLDYSIPAISYDSFGKVNNFYPFVVTISNEEFNNFLNNNSVTSFDEYAYFNNSKKTIIDAKRSYIIGTFEIKKAIKQGQATCPYLFSNLLNKSILNISF